MDLQEEVQAAIAALNDANSSEYVGDCEALGRAEAVLKKIVALNVLQERTCGTCRHWTLEKDAEGRVGHCAHVLSLVGVTPKHAENTYVYEQESVRRKIEAFEDDLILRTLPSFGCLLWTVKQP